MNTYYTNERNTQILIALLKAHEIKRIVVSPGGTNIGVVASLQHDPYFELYSCVDERSAAYMACGMAAESGEPVALSCTGATASRNYAPALTEAFYRKLPILAITASQPGNRIGHNVPQVTDRRSPMPDLVKLSVQIPIVRDRDEVWECEVKINQALLELKRNGGGPVHINIVTEYSWDFSVKELPPVRVIRRIDHNDEIPSLTKGRVAIYVGAHGRWSERLTNAVDSFCEMYDGAVLCDHTSNYQGKYRIDASLVAQQRLYRAECCAPRIMIHIGEVSGAYMSLRPRKTWRVSADGLLKDTFKTLEYVFEMEEFEFFEKYVAKAAGFEVGTSYYNEWCEEYNKLSEKIPELPFSNAWVAQQTAPCLPGNSVLHLGILNSLRAWNFIKVRNEILCYSNTGGFGIDGNTSSLIGASLVDSQKLFFGIVGDLSFFYDMNSIGNRHVGNNIRLMIVNNGLGAEMTIGDAVKRSNLREESYHFISARGHFGNKSRDLVRHYAEDLGFEYLCASGKDEYLDVLPRFTIADIMAKPIILEVFTSDSEEEKANDLITNLETTMLGSMAQTAMKILPPKSVETVKRTIKRIVPGSV